LNGVVQIVVAADEYRQILVDVGLQRQLVQRAGVQRASRRLDSDTEHKDSARPGAGDGRVKRPTGLKLVGDYDGHFPDVLARRGAAEHPSSDSVQRRGKVRCAGHLFISYLIKKSQDHGDVSARNTPRAPNNIQKLKIEKL